MAATTKPSAWIYYQNVRGLRSKAHIFSEQLVNNNYPIICLTETWFQDDNIDSHYFPQYYSIYRNDRNLINTKKSKGGGVLIAVNTNLFPYSSRRHEYDAPDIEATWITTKLKGLNYLIGTIYIPPDYKHSTVSKYLELLSDKLMSYKGNIIILGDFNVPGINWKHLHAQDITHHAVKNKADEVLKFATALNFTQINQLVPYTQMLDLCFVNSDVFELQFAEDPLVSEDRHHEALILAGDPGALPRFYHHSAKPIYSKGSYLPMFNLIKTHNWDKFYTLQLVDDKVLYLTQTMQNAMSSCIPTSTTKTSSFPLWFSKLSIFLTKRKNHFHKLFKRTGNVNYHINFTLYRRDAKTSIKSDKIAYYRNLNDNISQNPKKFWQYVKTMRKGFHNKISLKVNNTTVTDPATISELFATKFATVFAPSTPGIPALDPAHQLDASLHNGPDFTISQGMVTWSIKSLKSSFSKGPDNIPNFIVKGCASVLTPLLADIFNSCLRKGFFPSLWKKALVLPLHKKGCTLNSNNYRPISLLCTFSKIFEKILHKFLIFHTKNKLFTYQHGFAPKKTTITNLIDFYFPIYDKIISRGQVDCIYFDFSSAFDMVNHNLLVSKLNRVGIHNNIINVINNYLTGRSFQVKMIDYLSTSRSITSGVPQGSCLSPLLFIIFMDDIHRVVKFSQLSLFADDMKISKTIESQDDCVQLQADINSIADWSAKNSMLLNDSKTQLISFTRKHKPITGRYHLQSKPLLFLHSIKDLGILVDEKLLFHHHIASLKSAANKLLGLIKHLTFHASNPHSTLCLFYALIRSKLEYGSELWNNLSSSDITKLQKIQDKLVSYVHSKFGLTLDLQPLEERRQLLDAIFLHKLYNNNLECPRILEVIGLKSPRLEARQRGLFYYTGCENGLMYRLINNLNLFHRILDFAKIDYKQLIKNR